MSANEESEMKGGHLPAVKAGGMRITQHKPAHEKVESSKPEKDEDEEQVEEVVPSPPKQQLLISGAIARGDADFPPEAVQAAHVKPMPSHDFRSHASKPNIIHQPRK